ncbi:putative uncharacterized oxidoreductase [Clavispora lusitaniae]|uniref:Oxidoreductase n=2 Tax=Clavispora lusitaniae TaxID=36911 RepID=C4Y587_CLAL4|nr:uncharacterized protein CLUG_03321 [Clavispora lusitaniae ATCC 42720]KAF5210117.1 hypothetical protein E0198_002978 [Clavispora lusitaniae]EEQ39193.1 hypothetical protein CLUG_03321 [Clavispora lusitaniae ATCC 42720]QFZ28096.1 putative uncharacterized oxidoreductase [Clavispora lusitaniae]QFZ33759.1 putative uncharacterized oxidoreductase [Clavispora lusitaniae]QFZ39443.1 putative uncharacterized oxidoreductase [Clavispora lusitaniae]
MSLPSSLIYRVHRQLRKLSHRLVGHTYDAKRDIVLVTGGCSGLGHHLVTEFAARGSRVVVLDVAEPRNPVRNVTYYRCDIGSMDNVLACHERIKADIGIVTVLVNNAGITGGQTVLDLSVADIDKTVRVNLLSNFYTIKVFLPDMLKESRGYIVTIGSVLAYMSPARLSAYGASKAGLVALHESLTYELGPPSVNSRGIKTLLVCPGQMKTDLFRGVRTPWSLVAPELEPAAVAQNVVHCLELGERGEIQMPFYGKFLPVYRAIPWPVAELARHLSGIDRSMRTFREAVSRMVSREASAAVSVRSATSL